MSEYSPPPRLDLYLSVTAPVAQRIEHLTTDQKVRGSNPLGRASNFKLKITPNGESARNSNSVFHSLILDGTSENNLIIDGSVNEKTIRRDMTVLIIHMENRT
jgi:hypothetical protein